MNILVHMPAYFGGAAFSCFQYSKVFAEMGHNVITCGKYYDDNNEKYSYIVDKYESAGFKTYNVNKVFEELSRLRIRTAIKSIYDIYNIIFENNIDLLITSDHDKVFFLKNLINQKDLAIINLVAGGEFNCNPKSKKFKGDGTYICFSKENIDSLANSGFSMKNKHLVSNRIDCIEDNNWEKHYLIDNNEPIRLLIASRITKGKVESIKTVISATEYLFMNKQNIVLRIAGAGDCLDEIRTKADEVNKSVGKNIINILGYVKDMNEEFKNAHIVFGKGRSVLEPIIMNRIGVVVGENEEMSLCTKESFTNLYQYNFSGRCISNSFDRNDLLNLVISIRNRTIDYYDFEQAFSNVRKNYHVKFLGDKLSIIVQENVHKYNVTQNHQSNFLTKAIDIILITIKFIIYIILKTTDRLF